MPGTGGLEKIREIAGRVAAPLGLEVVEVELRGGGKGRMLRITIDRIVEQPIVGQGVTHGDCEAVSRQVSAILDVEDPVPGGSYTLEVSSPGLDRKLVRPDDYQRFVGSRVKLTTREAIAGNRHFEGRLEGFQQGVISLDLAAARRGKPKPAPEQRSTLEIPLENVEKANLVPEI